MDNNQICNCKRCNGIAHEVKRGDTLYTLSRLYNVSVGNIMKENKGINPYNLMIGEKICIPMRTENFPFYPDRRDIGNMPNGEMEMNSYDNENYDVEYLSNDYDDMSVKDIVMNSDISINEFSKIIKKYIKD